MRKTLRQTDYVYRIICRTTLVSFSTYIDPGHSFFNPQFILLLYQVSILLDHSTEHWTFLFLFLSTFFLLSGDSVMIFYWNDPRTSQNLVLTLRNLCPGNAHPLVPILFFTGSRIKISEDIYKPQLFCICYLCTLKSIFLTN